MAKSNVSVYERNRNFRKEAPKSSISGEQNWMSKTQSVSHYICKVNTSKFLVLVSSKFMYEKANDEIF